MEIDLKCYNLKIQIDELTYVGANTSDLIRWWLLVQSNKQVFSIKRVGFFVFISPFSLDDIAADENLNDDQ